MHAILKIGSTINNEAFMEIKQRFLADNEALVGYRHDFPVIVGPEADNSLAGLLQLIANHRDHVMDLTHKHGALLFRGFQIQEAAEFEKVLLALELNPTLNYFDPQGRP